MQRLSLLILDILIVALLLLYAITYQVRFDEMAILTTFGRAEEGSSKNVEGKGAGLHWKWPWPIQQVRKFDARVRVLSDRLEQQETKDKHVVILSAYTAWKITDPLAFYRSLRNATKAQQFLRDRLRTARAEIGNFTFDELTNVDPAKVRLAEAEAAILKRMQGDLAGQSLGVAIRTVGIRRVVLPAQITRSVFQRMRQTRQRLAQNARSEGEAIARSIRAKARSDEQRILAFADRKAQAIRAEGDEAAARYYEVFAENEDFAIFVRKLQALQETLSHNTTFLLDTKITPFDMLAPAGGESSATRKGEALAEEPARPGK